MSLTDEIIQRYNDSRTARMAQEATLNRTPLNTLADVGFQSNASSHIGMLNQGIGNLVSLANIGNTRAENQRVAAIEEEAAARGRELQDAELMFKSKDADIAGRNAAVNERNAAANEQQVKYQGQQAALKAREVALQELGIREHNRLINMADAEVNQITGAYAKLKETNAGIMNSLIQTGAVQMIKGVPTPTATMNEEERKQYMLLKETTAPDLSGLDKAAKRLYDSQNPQLKIQSLESIKAGLLSGVNSRVNGLNTASESEGKLIAAAQEDYAAQKTLESQVRSAGEWGLMNNLGGLKSGDNVTPEQLDAIGAAVLEDEFQSRRFAQEESESEQYKKDSTIWVGGPGDSFGSKFATQNEPLYKGLKDDFAEVTDYANQAINDFATRYEAKTGRKLDQLNPYSMQAASNLIHRYGLLRGPIGETWDATVSNWGSVPIEALVTEFDRATRFQQKAIRDAETQRGIAEHDKNTKAGHAARHGLVTGVSKLQAALEPYSK